MHETLSFVPFRGSIPFRKLYRPFIIRLTRKWLSTEFIEAVNDYTHFRTDEAFIQLPCNFGKNNSNFDYSFRNCKQNIRHRIYTQQRKKSKIRNQYSVVMLRYHFFDFDTICWLFRRSYVIVSQALRFESEKKPRILISSPRWERSILV